MGAVSHRLRGQLQRARPALYRILRRQPPAGSPATPGQESPTQTPANSAPPITTTRYSPVSVLWKPRFTIGSPRAFESRSYVDTGPLIERDLARQAGIGWTAKNTCTLNQQLGSMLFLCCIVTSLDVGPASLPTPATDRCGTCRRCIEACPTDALVAPGQMDASRCIAYLTIEKRGSIPEELRVPIGRQVFGCDICQEVCPWNRKAGEQTGRSSSTTRSELINPALSWLADCDPEEFNRQFRGSPVNRTKRIGLLRNVAIAMGNSGQREFLPQLDAWSKNDDPVLAEAAAWAIQRFVSTKIRENTERPPCVGEAVRLLVRDGSGVANDIGRI